MAQTEYQKPAEVRSRQEKSFAAMVRAVLNGNLFYQEKYRPLEFTAKRPVGLSDLADLPFTLRDELIEDQQAAPPFGTNLTFSLTRYTRVHPASRPADGELRWLDTEDSWSWWLECWKQALEAAGVTPEDRVLVADSAHPSVGLCAAFDAGQRLGALMIPGDGGRVDVQLGALRDYRATVLVTTGRRALDICRAACSGDQSADDCPPRLVIHSTEPSSVAYGGPVDDPWEDEGGWSARRSSLAMDTEIGLWAHECDAERHLHVNEEQFVAEVIDPRSAQPSPIADDGVQRGELVLTNLGRVGSPLIRYRTNLLVELSRRPCTCGRRTGWIVA
jgi:phenylacetate-CoA ligase